MKIIDVRKSIYLLAIGVGLVSLFAAVRVANAESWLWTNGLPMTVSKVNVDPGLGWLSDCESRYNSSRLAVTVQGTGAPIDRTSDCLIAEGQNFKLLSYASNQSLAIQFAGDQNAHAIRGADCRQCVYLPSKDILVNIDAQAMQQTGKIMIYKNFVSKLRLQNMLSLSQRYYQLDQAEPDQIIGGHDAQDNYIGYSKHLVKSQNDRWLAVEFVGAGFFRIDMESLQVLKFSSSRTNYAYSSPEIELDISNDGQHIAVAGNYDNSMYDIVPGCGYSIPNALSLTESLLIQPQQVSCPQAYFGNMTGTDNYLAGMTDITQLQFNDDGGEVTFYARASNFSIPPLRVMLRANGYAGQQPLDYLALGDSYSSGEGDTEKTSTGGKYYRPFTDNNENKATNTPAEKCHVSTRSYPYKLAAGMNLSISGPKKWDTVACSGATTWDVKSEGSEGYTGQWNRLLGYNVPTLKTQALNEMIPGRQKQIEFVKKYKPSVITLTMGGNDVGFGDKVSECVISPISCDYATEKRGDISSSIYKQYQKLKQLYQDLYNASGSKSKIYVIGYPAFISDAIDAKCDTNVVLLDSKERELIVNSITYLNNIISQAANAAGVKYLDIENSLLGHRLCDNGEKYMTGASDPLNFSNNRQESFHPNAKGNQSIALDIWSEHNVNNVSLLDYDICPQSNDNTCPDLSVNELGIVKPVYFSSVDSNKNVENKRMTSPEQQINSLMTIVLDKFTLLPGSLVKLIGHSDPINLGEYTVDENGSLNISTLIPSAMSPGFHSVIISGKTYSGDDIEYEQSILVKSSNPNDIDGDGVNDSKDKCLFITLANKDYDADGIDDACDTIIGEAPTKPSPTPTPTTTPSSPIPKPSPSTMPTLTTIVTQVINVIVAIVLLLTSLLKKLLLKL